jgi:pyruvate dehydrogenase E2 component (dihydrolipoamide acetyltransferase)
MSEDKPIGAGLPPLPAPDFSRFGEVEERKLSRVQALTAQFMHRNWLAIPHVTHHDLLDITALEEHRKASNAGGEGRLTPLSYQVRAVVAALREMPLFNASLGPDAQTLILKKYYNIGIAVETPQGLLVPVIRGCDGKTLRELAAEIAELSATAREKGLKPAQMAGGSFTISSLGGIGGVGFTPIINAPEVAILGVSRADWQPRRGEAGELVWRLMLPVSLSYDHRVINGADAARFTRFLGEQLAAPERL